MVSYDDYVAIIGDVLDSRKIRDRRDFQRHFKQVLATINEKYFDDLASNFTITLGDEFQGLLKNRAHVITIITEIEMAMAPFELRFGIGIGDVTTDISFEHSSEIDGPAYHRARQMIDEVERKKTQYNESQSNMMICSGEANDEVDELLNAILSACTAIKLKWTNRQKEIIHSYLTNGENQYRTANTLNIGQSSVNKALKATNFYTYQSAMNTVNAFLSRERGSYNV